MVSPGFEFDDYEAADRAELMGLWRELAELMRS